MISGMRVTAFFAVVLGISGTASALGACTKASSRSSSSSPARVETRAAGARSCETCHAEIAQEWAGSFHRAAFTNPTFQASLALEEEKDRAFCTNCHAPRSEASGIDCVACHGARFEAPHGREATTRTVAQRVAACASCHEFSFPDREELVQKTVSEHAASPHADVACADCHMPRRGDHRDHRFVGGHSIERVRSAVEVFAERAGARGVRVVIRTHTGHAFPTGDMFRRVRLQVFAEGPQGEILADAERVFERTWTGIAGSESASARTEASDTRLRGTWESLVDLDASRPITRVRWQLRYDRVLSSRGEQRALVSSDLVREGEVVF